MSTILLHAQLTALRLALTHAAELAARIDTDDATNRWFLRGVEVRLQSAADLVGTATVSLRAMLDMDAAQEAKR